MDGQTIAIVVGVASVFVFAIVFVVVLRRKDNLAGGVDVPGVGKAQFKAGNNPRDAVIRDAEGRDIDADAPQGSAIIERAKGRDMSAKAGGTRDPKA